MRQHYRKLPVWQESKGDFLLSTNDPCLKRERPAPAVHVMVTMLRNPRLMVGSMIMSWQIIAVYHLCLYRILQTVL